MRKYGVSVPKGEIATSPDQAKEAAQRLGMYSHTHMHTHTTHTHTHTHTHIHTHTHTYTHNKHAHMYLRSQGLI